MTAPTTAPTPSPQSGAKATRPPLWRDVRVLRVVLQVAFLIAVVLLVSYLYGNMLTNLRRIGIRTDFAYLDRPAGFQIPGSDFRASQRIRDALGVGLSTTASLAFVGIVLTTLLGVVVGVARLSTNWLVRKAAAFYVEALRNQPPLLVIIFMFTAVALQFPRIATPLDLGGLAIVTNRTISVASPMTHDGAGAFALVLVAALVLGGALAVWRTRRSLATGEPHRRVLWGGGAFVAVALAGYVALGGPIGLSRPEVAGLQLAGGASMSASYFALLAALVIYTASYIAEIVRGSILAVPRGQTEAATALGLGSFQRLRFIVLPQAFRIAIPPMANQYLNLTKNSALGLAIAVPEVTTVTNIVIGNGHPAPQSIAVLMLIYLTLSLLIAAVTNLANRRLQVATR